MSLASNISIDWHRRCACAFDHGSTKFSRPSGSSDGRHGPWRRLSILRYDRRLSSAYVFTDFSQSNSCRIWHCHFHPKVCHYHCCDFSFRYGSVTMHGSIWCLASSQSLIDSLTSGFYACYCLTLKGLWLSCLCRRSRTTHRERFGLISYFSKSSRLNYFLGPRLRCAWCHDLPKCQFLFAYVRLFACWEALHLQARMCLIDCKQCFYLLAWNRDGGICHCAW